jgi:transcriptional regulator GlxA family with amidase domain
MRRTKTRVAVDSRVVELIELVSNTLAHPWCITELAATLRLSNNQVRRVFITHTGHPPMRHLKNIRLATARELLTSSRLSVKEVASLVGFSDLSHFVRAFRAHHGKPPSACRGRPREKVDTRD